MRELFDRLITMVDDIEVRGKRNRTLVDGTIEILTKLRGMIQEETHGMKDGEEGHGLDHK